MEFPGEKLVIKMWDTLVEKGIGGLIAPYYIPWKNKKLALGQIEVDRMIESATSSAEKEIEKISNNEPLLIEQNKTTLDFNNISQPVSVEDIVIQNNLRRLLRKEINVTNSIKYASQRLTNDNSETPKTEINEDWLNAWRENASKVSDEEVQSLWGNVLAQEFLEPGRYSLRLLEFLKTMSKSEALLIEKVAPFITSQGLIYQCNDSSANNVFDAFNIKKGELEFLEDLGLISMVSIGGKIATANNFSKEQGHYLAYINLNRNRLIEISGKAEVKKVKYNFYPMTKMGEEVISLVNSDINLDYVLWICTHFKEDYEVQILRLVNGSFEIEKTL